MTHLHLVKDNVINYIIRTLKNKFMVFLLTFINITNPTLTQLIINVTLQVKFI